MPIMTNAEAFRFDFRIYATELWSMSEEQFLEWLKQEWSCCDKEPPDAVPVVRCKDCKYYDPPVELDGMSFEGDCNFHDWYRAAPAENDFCSRAERKESCSQ